MKFAEAIARVEGFGANPTNIPTRHNNPGDIIAGQFSAAHGAIPGGIDPGIPGHVSHFAVFPNEAAGWAALRALLCSHYTGLTVRDAVNRYAPPCENNTANYVESVCKLTGLTPDTILTPENIG